MDWFKHAQNDWDIYSEIDRIKKYVQFEKITKEQFQEITGEPYIK